MSKINPDTLKDLFLAAMTDVPDFEYISGEQPFVIRYKGQRYHIYMLNLRRPILSRVLILLVHNLIDEHVLMR